MISADRLVPKIYRAMLLLLSGIGITSLIQAQEIQTLELSSGQEGLSIVSIDEYELPQGTALFSLELDGIQYSSLQFIGSNNTYILNEQLSLTWEFPPYDFGIRGRITLENTAQDTLEISNIVPFGASGDHVYISGLGDHYLSRSHLFRPASAPVNVILPDNAWELGFSAREMNEELYVAALARRDLSSLEKGERRRFLTRLYPGGKVSYTLWMNRYSGAWQNGLAKLFREGMIYDIEPGSFENSMFERSDLSWIRKAYVSHLVMAWDSYYYDYETGLFKLEAFLQKGEKLYGGDDFIGLWPTWPTLGIDQRNQWDLFRDLPGGLDRLKKMSATFKEFNTKLFICYNPWDQDTRMEEHMEGMAELIAQTDAMGVVLDTRGASSRELQEAADRVRDGVIMYSEGMAVPKDMQWIISGRVHNALYYCPMLNLNKFIKPEFSIFRVAELAKEPVQREICISFFNGHGIEFNIFSPGKPAWLEEQYSYLGRTTRILRENNANFISRNYIPLLPTYEEDDQLRSVHKDEKHQVWTTEKASRNGIWVNKWPANDKVLYTVYSTKPEGYKGYLFEVEPQEGFHFVDLWHHRLLSPVLNGKRWLIEAETDAFNASSLGSNDEGEVDCIARFPKIIQASLEGDSLRIRLKANTGDRLLVWAGNPDYGKTPFVAGPGESEISLINTFGPYEGKFVIQLFEDDCLLDETITEVKPGTPRLISSSTAISASGVIKRAMLKIPAGKFTFSTSNGDEFIPYPHECDGQEFEMKAYYMDKYPVTNAQFREFLQKSAYEPSEKSNFLKHWKNGAIPPGMEEYPVVYVSLEDARAYAQWAGKRLPTELEWQYAAQTAKGYEWPWQQDALDQEEEEVTGTLSVYDIKGLSETYCNTGNGSLYPVGSYPKGANPYGLEDLVGSVWQLTNDVYASASYRYIIMKGGSYYKASGSWWYVQGGPRPLHYRQYLLRVFQGFERNATVGFRCVAD
jgi:iron(II)-dependent oxidoreductase